MFTFTDALVFAAEIHRGQKDKGGVDYIKHPLYLYHKIQRKGGSNEAQMAAILHDSIEDSEEDSEYLFEALEKSGCPESVLEALRLLTHIKDEYFIKSLEDEGVVPKNQIAEMEYLNYIKSISKNDIARMVKIEDLRHNSDIRRLKPDQIGSTKTVQRIMKYGKALQILNGGRFGYV